MAFTVFAELSTPRPGPTDVPLEMLTPPAMVRWLDLPLARTATSEASEFRLAKAASASMVLLFREVSALNVTPVLPVLTATPTATSTLVSSAVAPT